MRSGVGAGRQCASPATGDDAGWPEAGRSGSKYCARVPYTFAVVEISDHVEAKINSLHGVTADDVLDALESYEAVGWDEDPDRGPRLLVTSQIGQRRIRVVLYEIDAGRGEWRLATAYSERRP